MSTPLSLLDLDLPRRNGELAFDAPWQGTVFALAAALEALVQTLPGRSVSSAGVSTRGSASGRPAGGSGAGW